MVKYNANQRGLVYMKKFLIALSYVFIFLFTGLTNVKTDAYTKTIDTNEKELVETKKETTIVKNESENTEEIKEEQKVVENEPEAIEPESSNIIETSEVNEYVQEESPVTETYYENYGTYGRLYVSWYSVALYDYNVNTRSSSSLQEIVNAEDSAAYYANKGKLIIADHNYQGFSILADLTEGTTSYIQFSDGSSIGYRLIKKSKGYNTGPDLVDTEGNSFYDMDASLIMYTCYEDGIMVTLWA